MSTYRRRILAASCGFVSLVFLLSGAAWAEGSDDLGVPTGVACGGEEDCDGASFCSSLGVCAMSWDDCVEGDGLCQGLNGEGDDVGSTTLRVEILDDQETFVYTGPGTISVRTPGNSDLNGSANGDNIYNSGETVTPAAGQTGAYRVVLQARTPCTGADQCDATYDCEQNEGSGGCNLHNVSNDTLLSGISTFYAWDVTVFDTDDSTPIDGRVWSSNYSMNAGNFSRARGTNTSFYALVPGGVSGTNAVIELRFDGLAGFIWNLFVNRTGPLDSTGVARGRSVFGNAFFASNGFQIFLNEPDPALYEYTPVRQDCDGEGDDCVEPSVENFDFIGGPGDVECGGVLSTDDQAIGGTFVFDTNVEGTYQIYCDLDGDGASIVDVDDLVIIGAIDPGDPSNACERDGETIHCDVLWDGLDSGGGAVPPGEYACDVRVAVGEIHYVGRDMETSFEGFRLFEAEPGEAPRGLDMFWNDTLVQNAAIPMLNPGQSVLLDETSAETSGINGVNAGLTGEGPVPHTVENDGNARAWGRFSGGCGAYRGGPPTGEDDEGACFCEVFDDSEVCQLTSECPDGASCLNGLCRGGCHASKGDGALLDTFTWVAAATATLAEVLTVYDGSEDDTDQDGVPTYWELCVFDTNPDSGDTDDDDVGDFVEVGGQDGIDTFTAPDTDDNGTIDANDPDDDGDGIPTADEDVETVDGDPTNDDTDDNNIPNYLDPDDDGDGIPTEDEDLNGNDDYDDDQSDDDGIPNYLDPDDDGDGVDTIDEDLNGDGVYDENTDGDELVNYLDPDDDGDGLPTEDEDLNGDDDWFNDDTDDNEVPNFLDNDDDGDLVPTETEDLNGDDDYDNDNTDDDELPDYLDPDDDGDLVPTEAEDVNGDGDPTNDDTDDDETPDYLDIDDDGDGINTEDEDVNDDGDPTNDDSDGDGIPDYLDNLDDGPDGDLDEDGVVNSDDNCPEIANPEQDDLDDDDIGDACDDDLDGDDVLNDDDNCPVDANDDQSDIDDDDLGDVCDDDIDGDGIANDDDNCPTVANPDQEDVNDDGVGDVCEADTDEDGVPDSFDNCPMTANADQTDSDDDGVGDVCDNCPDDANGDGQDDDLDGDGEGDLCDDDRDGDGLSNDDEVLVHGTDPDDADTDDGGVNDGDEVTAGTDPLDPADDLGAFTISGGQFFGCSTADGGRGAEGAWMLLWIGLALVCGLGRRRRRA